MNGTDSEYESQTEQVPVSKQATPTNHRHACDDLGQPPTNELTTDDEWK